jgi:predicted 3-demethylubiquinone-9 3-methyltransferase (glyoxalase superfamily)
MTTPKNTICLWYNRDAEEAARFYAATFPDSGVKAVHHAPADYPSGKAGDVLTVEFTVFGIPCLGLNGGRPSPRARRSPSRSRRTTRRRRTATGTPSSATAGRRAPAAGARTAGALNWQITPRVLIDAMAAGGEEARRAFEAMMRMTKIDVAKIAAVRRG